MAVKRVVPDASRGTKVAQTNHGNAQQKKSPEPEKKVLRKIGVKDDIKMMVHFVVVIESHGRRFLKVTKQNNKYSM